MQTCPLGSLLAEIASNTLQAVLLIKVILLILEDER